MITSLLRPLFVSKARIKILDLFFKNPEEEFFVREITRKTDEQINAVRRELENLENANILYSYTTHGKKYFSLNPDYFFYNELSYLFAKASSPSLQFAEKFKTLGKSISLLLITGKLVGLPINKTPIDLFIVGDIDKEEVSTFIQYEMEEDEEIRFAVVSEKEFLERVKMKDPVLKKLLLIPENIISINNIRKKLKNIEE